MYFLKISRKSHMIQTLRNCTRDLISEAPPFNEAQLNALSIRTLFEAQTEHISDNVSI